MGRTRDYEDEIRTGVSTHRHATSGKVYSSGLSEDRPLKVTITSSPCSATWTLLSSCRAISNAIIPNDGPHVAAPGNVTDDIRWAASVNSSRMPFVPEC